MLARGGHGRLADASPRRARGGVHVIHAALAASEEGLESLERPLAAAREDTAVPTQPAPHEHRSPSEGHCVRTTFGRLVLLRGDEQIQRHTAGGEAE